MTQIEQIKNKIEGLIDKEKHHYYEEYDCAYRDGNNAVCYTLLSFIDSLEKEEPPRICPKCIHYKEDMCQEPYGGMTSKINRNGIYDCTAFIENTLFEVPPKIKGWVARDKSGDLYFFHYDCKPHRTDGVFYSECSEDVFHLDNSMFSEIDWQTEPIEVELTISRVKTE